MGNTINTTFAVVGSFLGLSMFCGALYFAFMDRINESCCSGNQSSTGSDTDNPINSAPFASNSDNQIQAQSPTGSASGGSANFVSPSKKEDAPVLSNFTAEAVPVSFADFANPSEKEDIPPALSNSDGSANFTSPSKKEDAPVLSNFTAGAVPVSFADNASTSTKVVPVSTQNPSMTPTGEILQKNTETWQRNFKEFTKNDGEEILKEAGYKVVKEIKRGACSNVFECELDDGKHIAVKFSCPDPNSLFCYLGSEVRNNRDLRELKVHESGRCIVPVTVKTFPDTGKMQYAISEAELASEGDAYAYFRGLAKKERNEKAKELGVGDIWSPDNANYGEIKRFAWQVLQGLKVLHDLKIVHRDIALRNVLVDKAGENFNYFISDFDRAAKYSGENWFRDESAVDIYDVGKMLFELWRYSLHFGADRAATDCALKCISWYSEPDFSGEYDTYEVNRLRKAECINHSGEKEEYFNPDGERLIKRIRDNKEFMELCTFVRKLTAKESDDRLTVDEALEDDYFKEFREDTK